MGQRVRQPALVAPHGDVPHVQLVMEEDKIHPGLRGDPAASHAWVEAFTPTHGWRGFDPTHDRVVGPSYVKVAVGRDYADVPPTRGSFRGKAGERLFVSVESRPVD